MDYLKLSKNMRFFWNMQPTTAMKRAEERFLRDVDKILWNDKEMVEIFLNLDEDMPEEAWQICVVGHTNPKQQRAGIYLTAADELGVIYALCYLSREYLGILPFWFWNDQEWEKKETILIPEGNFYSKLARVRFRGWFVNDEVLIDKWTADQDNEYVWEMVFEALLRFGGNLVIPGTDKNSKKHRKLASDMGLFITHHHAEPLGAEMFSRAFPDLIPSYADHPDKFHKLWREAIAEQAKDKVIWNLGFRGQGDRPFWADDPKYDTKEKRGELISKLIRLQYEEVKRQVKEPVCCTNLYGEVMELYKQGVLDLPEDIIYIWADNGYGKMVSRRQGRNNPRVPALPQKGDGKKHGIYYHASFYDLQAAGHITMLPNSPEFVTTELSEALEHGADEFWIINCSNVKPHTYMLDLMASLWQNGMQADYRAQIYAKALEKEGEIAEGSVLAFALRGRDPKEDLTQEKQLSDLITKAYVAAEFSSHRKEIWECYQLYHRYMLHYGAYEDERAGEQFYSYMVRDLSHGWLLNDSTRTESEAVWATGEMSLRSQFEWLEKCILSGIDGLKLLYRACEEVCGQLEGHDKELFEDSIYLQAKIHFYCAEGVKQFCEGFDYFINQYDREAFWKVKLAAEWFARADLEMRNREHDKWRGFYANDCLTDIKFTAYCLDGVAHFIRNIKDGPHFYKWAREYLCSQEDRKVMLITNMENHMTDEELYQAMKQVEFEKKKKE